MYQVKVSLDEVFCVPWIDRIACTNRIYAFFLLTDQRIRNYGPASRCQGNGDLKGSDAQSQTVGTEMAYHNLQWYVPPSCPPWYRHRRRHHLHWCLPPQWRYSSHHHHHRPRVWTHLRLSAAVSSVLEASASMKPLFRYILPCANTLPASRITAWTITPIRFILVTDVLPLSSLSLSLPELSSLSLPESSPLPMPELSSSSPLMLLSWNQNNCLILFHDQRVDPDCIGNI